MAFSKTPIKILCFFKLYSNILWKGATINAKEEDSKNTKVTDMIAYSNQTAKIYYCIQKKQLNAASAATKIHQHVISQHP